ncbi:PhzF family isomerase [Paraburkholderia fungorum]|uniref:PhzF family isomerase n=1 Tax=Paraburkholderia fungorum TaxID=134537 RepID=UPI0038BBEDBA
MNEPQLFHIDAFTRTAFRGNPAGVVLNADSLDANQMQDIARELKHSETAFVMSPHGSDHDVYIRYFTPVTEVPICGHATIAAHYARARSMSLGDTVVTQKTGAGLQTITVETDGDDYRIVMQQGPISFDQPFDSETRRLIAQALRIDEYDIDETKPVQIVSTGHSKVMVPLRASVALDTIVPDHALLVSLSEAIGCNGFFPFLMRSEPASTDGRMFAPAIGIAEDPVTGNANGPLGAYLVRHALMPNDGVKLTFDGHQGRALRRDGVVKVTVDIQDGEPVRVSIKGEAVMLFSTALNPPIGR